MSFETAQTLQRSRNEDVLGERAFGEDSREMKRVIVRRHVSYEDRISKMNEHSRETASTA